MSSDRNVRLFLCTTYRDMQAEREYLHQVVFPQVQQMYEKHGFTFEVVDPRWNAQSEDEAEDVATLPQALADIDACRPYFMAILGAHYGKMIVEIPDNLARQLESVRHYVRSSRIHLEILHGVLQNPEASRPLFYFRKPGFLHTVPDYMRAIYEADNPAAAQKLELLKRAIVHRRLPAKEYPCRWDAEKGSLTGFEGFGQRVADDLVRLVGITEQVPIIPPVQPAPVTPPMAAVASEGAGLFEEDAAMAALAEPEVASPGGETMEGVAELVEEPVAEAAVADEATEPMEAMVAEVADEVQEAEASSAAGEVAEAAVAEIAADEQAAAVEEPVATGESEEPIVAAEEVSETPEEATSEPVSGELIEEATAEEVAAEVVEEIVEVPPEENLVAGVEEEAAEFLGDDATEAIEEVEQVAEVAEEAGETGTEEVVEEVSEQPAEEQAGGIEDQAAAFFQDEPVDPSSGGVAEDDIDLAALFDDESPQ
ncbi:MAG: hypothetical protein KatS3mg105_0004 [Gemmatales bacterium]|nr:MAG: hypothetical protein KatS3mg105_0004 [Gemmatales bacterium]